jgi:3-hydroxyisobutyrate dehydrogenase-like beta-hydroxyacid dehydrogenase
MGHGIGKNLLAKGFGLNVLAHRNRGPVDDLLSRGAVEKHSPKEIAADADLVLLCVTGTPQVEAVMRGPQGLLDKPRKGLVIADCSTAEPQSTIELAAEAARLGVQLLDTPMTRTPKEAEEGRLGLMVGGPEAAIAAIRPVLDCFSDTIVHAGPVGAAHQLKLLNNFLSLSHAAVAAEAIATAAKAGVDMQAFRDIVMAGGAASVMFDRLIRVPLANDDTAAKFAIRNARKDLRYYTNMTEQLPVTSFIAESVHQTYVLADNMGYGERYVPRLIDCLISINGLKT